jgi:hypothetical protein
MRPYETSTDRRPIEPHRITHRCSCRSKSTRTTKAFVKSKGRGCGPGLRRPYVRSHRCPSYRRGSRAPRTLCGSQSMQGIQASTRTSPASFQAFPARSERPPYPSPSATEPTSVIFVDSRGRPAPGPLGLVREQSVPPTQRSTADTPAAAARGVHRLEFGRQIEPSSAERHRSYRDAGVDGLVRRWLIRPRLVRHIAAQGRDERGCPSPRLAIPARIPAAVTICVRSGAEPAAVPVLPCWTDWRKRKTVTPCLSEPNAVRTPDSVLSCSPSAVRRAPGRMCCRGSTNDLRASVGFERRAAEIATGCRDRQTIAARV